MRMTFRPATAPCCGNLFDIKRYSSHDGPGIRTTVFFAGCPLRCAWCHNPEAIALCGEQADAARDMMRERGTSLRWVGAVAADDVLAEIERDVPYFDLSGGGVTFSGGEPLHQAEFLLELLRRCKSRDIHTAVDTTGCAKPAEIEAVASLADLFLYDLKLMDPAAHRQFTGVTNHLILDNLALLDKLGANVWIRIPFVPGANAGEENIQATISFLTEQTSFRLVSLLPYHRIGEAKYARLGMDFRMHGVEPPTAEAVAAARAAFENAGFEVQIAR
jgi:pyruvate formate lyase activating enzyme